MNNNIQSPETTKIQKMLAGIQNHTKAVTLTLLVSLGVTTASAQDVQVTTSSSTTSQEKGLNNPLSIAEIESKIAELEENFDTLNDTEMDQLFAYQDQLSAWKIAKKDQLIAREIAKTAEQRKIMKNYEEALKNFDEIKTLIKTPTN